MNKNELYFVKILRKLKHTRKKERARARAGVRA